MPSRRVSVIVPTFNRAHYLGQCLESLIEQTVPAHEIIVVDDGSEDDTERVIGRFSGRVVYLRKDNGGKASALNMGIKTCTGDTIWIFDDDDIACPNAIRDRLMAWEEKPGAGFVFGPHLICDETGHGDLVVARQTRIDLYKEESFFFELLKGCFFHLNSCLIERSVLLDVGAFDESLKRAQDYDFQLRLVRNHHGVRSTMPVFKFRRHAGMRGDNVHRHTAKDRDRIFLAFDAVVGRKLRESLDLGEYLCPPKRGSLTDREVVAGLLARALVMASKGCVEEMTEDLIAVAARVSRVSQLSVSERRYISQTMHTGYAASAIDARWSRFLQGLAVFRKTAIGRAILADLAKGMFRLARSYPGSPRFRATSLVRALKLGLEAVVPIR